MKIEEFKQKQAALAKEIAEHGKTALLEGFEALFEAHPELQAVRWTQYTPYFNDGESCEFSVHDFEFKAVGLRQHNGEDDDFIDHVYDYRLNEEDKEAVRPAKSLLNRIQASSRALSGAELESVYLAAFGDHAQVTVARDLSVEVEEYKHE